MHIPGGNHANLGALFPKGKGHMQSALCIGDAESMKARLGPAVSGIVNDQKRLIEEHLLRFGPADAMFVGALAGIAVVPLKAGQLLEINHLCILS